MTFLNWIAARSPWLESVQDLIFRLNKAELLQEGIFFLIHLFASDVLLMKKLEFEKTKPTFIISILKVEYYVVLVSSISNLFTKKISLANKWMRF